MLTPVTRPLVGTQPVPLLPALATPRPAGPADPGGSGPPGEVTVRVLGPVDVVGATRPLRRAWTLDLVVYLAVHRRGAPADVWTAALWPDRQPAAPTLHSTVSAARRALGRAADGSDHLPRGRGILRLGPSVSTDWEELARLAGSGASPTGPVEWAAGLSMVRGRPFDGLRAEDWTVMEGIAAAAEDAVVQLALRLAGHHLGRGDGRGAELAARRGLLASPYDERLYRVLLEAADLQGNPGGVEAVMAELVRLVGPDAGVPGRPTAARPHRADPGVLALVHPQTASLYRTLSRCHRVETGIA